jgi:hypothetical protein
MFGDISFPKEPKNYKDAVLVFQKNKKLLERSKDVTISSANELVTYINSKCPVKLQFSKNSPTEGKYYFSCMLFIFVVYIVPVSNPMLEPIVLTQAFLTIEDSVQLKYKYQRKEYNSWDNIIVDGYLSGKGYIYENRHLFANHMDGATVQNYSLETIEDHPKTLGELLPFSYQQRNIRGIKKSKRSSIVFADRHKTLKKILDEITIMQNQF